MSKDRGDSQRYEMTIKMFGAQSEPAFETPEQQSAVWGRPWGCDNDVGRLRVVLMHRPGSELEVADPNKRIESIGTFGDLEEGWYWQSDTIPPISEMQAQHDVLVDVLRAEGVEVVFLEGVSGGRLKSCYTRDSAIAIKGGALVGRLGPRIRRGEELPVTRTLAKLGVPILRTIHGTGLLEGGSFVMVDVDTALVLASALPYRFLEKLKELKIRTVEMTPEDDPWIINCLAVRPGRLVMPPGASNRLLDRLAELDIEVVTVPYDKMSQNGGGIHCSTCPLVRDPVSYR